MSVEAETAEVLRQITQSLERLAELTARRVARETAEERSRPALSLVEAPAVGSDCLTKREAAALAGRDVRTIDSWVKTGRLTRYGAKGEHPRFSRSELLRLLGERDARRGEQVDRLAMLVQRASR